MRMSARWQRELFKVNISHISEEVSVMEMEWRTESLKLRSFFRIVKDNVKGSKSFDRAFVGWWKGV